MRYSYLILRMDECMDSLGISTIFTNFDNNSGYWHVEIRENDKDKTAFTWHHGLFSFIRMQLGLNNAPGTFRWVIAVILSQVKWQYALVYHDDAIVFSKSLEQHLDHVSTVLSLLKYAGVSLKMKKCLFFTDQVYYLGHIIRLGKLQVAAKTTEAVEGLQEPSKVSERK